MMEMYTPTVTQPSHEEIGVSAALFSRFSLFPGSSLPNIPPIVYENKLEIFEMRLTDDHKFRTTAKAVLSKLRLSIKVRKYPS